LSVVIQYRNLLGRLVAIAVAAGQTDHSPAIIIVVVDGAWCMVMGGCYQLRTGWNTR